MVLEIPIGKNGEFWILAVIETRWLTNPCFFGSSSLFLSAYWWLNAWVLSLFNSFALFLGFLERFSVWDESLWYNNGLLDNLDTGCLLWLFSWRFPFWFFEPNYEFGFELLFFEFMGESLHGHPGKLRHYNITQRICRA